MTARVGWTPVLAARAATPALTSARTFAATGLPSRICTGLSRGEERAAARWTAPGPCLGRSASRHRDLVRSRLHGDVADARRAHGEIRRPEEQVLLPDVLDDLFLVPDVVARGHDVDAMLEEAPRDERRHAEAGRGVLHVDDGQVGL